MLTVCRNFGPASRSLWTIVDILQAGRGAAPSCRRKSAKVGESRCSRGRGSPRRPWFAGIAAPVRSGAAPRGRSLAFIGFPWLFAAEKSQQKPRSLGENPGQKPREANKKPRKANESQGYALSAASAFAAGRGRLDFSRPEPARCGAGAPCAAALAHRRLDRACGHRRRSPSGPRPGSPKGPKREAKGYERV